MALLVSAVMHFLVRAKESGAHCSGNDEYRSHGARSSEWLAQCEWRK